VVSAALVIVTIWIAARLAGRIPAILAGLLLSTLGVAPRLEGFTLAGEQLALLPSACALAAFTVYLCRGGRGWLVATGLLTGSAVMVKQSGFDVGLAAVVWLLICRRRSGLAPAAVVVFAALVPAALAVALS